MFGREGELADAAEGHGATIGAAGRELLVHPTARTVVSDATIRSSRVTSARYVAQRLTSGKAGCGNGDVGREQHSVERPARSDRV
jgi:hypothetical protein